MLCLIYCVSPFYCCHIPQRSHAEAELGAALAGERMKRNGELTEIKSVVDEMMTLDASASGGGIAGRGDLFSPPRARKSRLGSQMYPSSSSHHDTTVTSLEVGAAAR